MFSQEVYISCPVRHYRGRGKGRGRKEGGVGRRKREKEGVVWGKSGREGGWGGGGKGRMDWE